MKLLHSRNIYEKTAILICLIAFSALGMNLNMRNIYYNRMHFPWAVGDSGKIFRFDIDSNVISIKSLNPEYNLTDISFVDTLIGFVVGNKPDNLGNWQGAIWKTTNSGKNWFIQIPASFYEPTPFLDIKVYNRYCVWIRCGNNYSLQTHDGGIEWLLTSKPIQ